MLKIFENDKITFQQKSLSKDTGAVLISDPSLFISDFFLNSFNKFSIIPIPREVKTLLLEKRGNSKINRYKVESFLKEALINSVSNPRYNNLDRIFEKGLEALKNGQDVYSTPNGGVLFIEWLYNRKEKVDNCECDLLIDEMCAVYNKISNEPFYPIALERLLKLFMLFYNKKLNKGDIFKISNFQRELLLLEDSELEYIEKEIDEKSSSLIKNINELKDIIISVQNEEKEIPSINIFNKCLEQLISFENKISSESKKILKENFVKISSDNNFEDTFLQMYEEVLY